MNMINFSLLKLKIDPIYSFVGIKKQGNELCFYIPKGFDVGIDELNTFTGKRDLFFIFYKIFDSFKRICVEKGYLEDNSKISTRERDGVIKSSEGSIIRINENNSYNIFYSKLDFIGDLLSAYEEPRILALAYRLGQSDKLDISKIYRYLHQAVYLDNNAAYVDTMILSRQVVQFESTDIVSMYCYLFCEVNRYLNRAVNAETEALAERFRQRYIGSQDTIFQEERYEATLDTLKDSLEVIDCHTAFKDNDYWLYYEAIESFLYGDWRHSKDGEIWGIKNFCDVWESLCLTHLVETVNPNLILYLDETYLSHQVLKRLKDATKILDLSYVFQLNKARLIPDVVVLKDFPSQFSDNKIYCVNANKNWNDYNYKTIIFGIGIKDAKVAYLDQSYEHTLEKLKELYTMNDYGALMIDSPLPDNFFSFWQIPDKFDVEFIYKMKYFNHFFYFSIKRGIFEWTNFLENILKPLGIILDLRYDDTRNNVFTRSLFREYRMEDLEKMFENFIRKFSNHHKEFFEIIDVKYLTYEYFLDNKNIEEIKQRSVRKQFVYEHLLQKSLDRRNDHYKNLGIRSSFWLPGYDTVKTSTLKDDSIFMSGYINLNKINLMSLLDSYL